LLPAEEEEEDDEHDEMEEVENESNDQNSETSEEEDNDNENNNNINDIGQNSRRAYLSTLRKVIERADVILHVLDARDPEGTKSSAIEQMVANQSGKRLVYVLNKADLVPKDILGQWLTYLRRSFPTVLFKSNTQHQRDHLSRDHGKVLKQDQENITSSSHAIGAEEIIQLLKNYARIQGGSSIITVGVVGFPNVGKSSFINSLTRRRVVSVSSTPGHTKSLQEVIYIYINS
jgi:nuclear GTP-binding protein